AVRILLCMTILLAFLIFKRLEIPTAATVGGRFIWAAMPHFGHEPQPRFLIWLVRVCRLSRQLCSYSPQGVLHSDSVGNCSSERQISQAEFSRWNCQQSSVK